MVYGGSRGWTRVHRAGGMLAAVIDEWGRSAQTERHVPAVHWLRAPSSTRLAHGGHLSCLGTRRRVSGAGGTGVRGAALPAIVVIQTGVGCVLRVEEMGGCVVGVSFP